MSQPQQMNMGGMGGPVGGAPPQQQQNAGTPSNGSGVNANDSAETVKRLNTYIYDYFLRNQHYDIARAMINSGNMELLTQPKQSPSQRQNQSNGVDEMDTDRPKDLPEPGLQNTEGPFLQDWWFQFWDIYQSRRNNASKQTTVSYLAAQRAAGAQALQVFDTWGGVLSPAMYREFSLPYLTRIAQELQRGDGAERTPLILFGKGNAAYLDDLSRSGAEGVGVD